MSLYSLREFIEKNEGCFKFKNVVRNYNKIVKNRKRNKVARKSRRINRLRG